MVLTNLPPMARPQAFLAKTFRGMPPECQQARPSFLGIRLPSGRRPTALPVLSARPCEEKFHVDVLALRHAKAASESTQCNRDFPNKKHRETSKHGSKGPSRVLGMGRALQPGVTEMLHAAGWVYWCTPVRLRRWEKSFKKS